MSRPSREERRRRDSFHLFPEYTVSERAVDAVVHAIGATGSVGAVAVLILLSVPDKPPVTIVSLIIYGLGLIAMTGFSAAYNLASRPRRKSLLRRLDHSAIFLMIAGTYTPFMLVSVATPRGEVLLAVLWVIAAVGVLAKLSLSRRFERFSVALYLMMGWAGLAAVDEMVAALPDASLILLGIGGVLYTVGVIFHLAEKMPFHNAIWHLLVLIAAGCHYAAILSGVVFLA